MLPRRELLPFHYFCHSAPSLPGFPCRPCCFAMSKKRKAKIAAIIKHIETISRPSILPIRRVRNAPAKPRRESPTSTAQKISNTSGLGCPFMASNYQPGGRLALPGKFVVDQQAQKQRQVKHGCMHEPLGTNVGLRCC